MALKEYIFIEGFAVGRGYNQLLKALYLSSQLHSTQTRKTGDPYLIHPTEVTATLIRFGIWDEDTLCISQLHDTGEDCGMTKEDLMYKHGMSEITADGVMLLTKDKRIPFEVEIENIALDWRCALVKIGDRGHNISTMSDAFSLKKQKEYIEETQLIINLCKKARRLYPQYGNYILEMRKNIEQMCKITSFFINQIERRDSEICDLKKSLEG